jgi:hypothetical protein
LRIVCLPYSFESRILHVAECLTWFGKSFSIVWVVGGGVGGLLEYTGLCRSAPKRGRHNKQMLSEDALEELVGLNGRQVSMLFFLYSFRSYLHQASLHLLCWLEPCIFVFGYLYPLHAVRLVPLHSMLYAQEETSTAESPVTLGRAKTWRGLENL